MIMLMDTYITYNKNVFCERMVTMIMMSKTKLKNSKEIDKVKPVAIAFSLLLVYPALAMTAAADTNLVANPGFEEGTIVPLNWTLVTNNGNTPIWDSVAHNDSKSIKISIPG